MGEIIQLSLSRTERLKNIKLIDSVFKSAISVKAFPLILSYKLATFPTETPVQFLFTVSKRNFKRAVDRNRIKRIMRDRLRLQKAELIAALHGKSIFGALIYTAKVVPDYREIDKSILKLIQKLDETYR
jgi:ribonuclease P protein component